MSQAGTHIRERRKRPLLDMEREMTRSFNRFVSTVAVGAALVGASLQAFAVTTTGALTTPPSVLVFDQKLVNGGVEVKYANIPSKGYVAVLGSDANGMPTGTPLGAQPINAGDHRDIKVALNGQPKAGDKLWVSLYFDTDGQAGFDAKADKPVWPDGVPTMNTFIVR